MNLAARHYRVAVQIQDEGEPENWQWATAHGHIQRFTSREDAEALASFGNPGEAKVIEVPAGWEDPDNILRLVNRGS